MIRPRRTRSRRNCARWALTSRCAVRTMRDARQPPHDGPACQRAAGRLLDPPACVVALAQALAADLSIHGWPGWSIQGGYLWPPGARRSRDAYSVRDVDWIT